MAGLRERIGPGRALLIEGVHPGAQAFVLSLIHRLNPSRPMLVIAPNPKVQETLHQDLQTWLMTRDLKGTDGQPDQTRPAEAPDPARRKQASKRARAAGAGRSRSSGKCSPGLAAATPVLFHPGWDVRPDTGGLPHVDVISERLETLIALARATDGGPAPVIVTDGTAALQRTFSRDEFAKRMRRLRSGDELDPLDLIEWLEDQGYEPEAQVTLKGTLALRGGIVDVFPPASPWPLRCEFFGNTVESLREFDPQTQLARTPLETAMISPAGELGLLRRAVAEGQKLTGSLLDHLPAEAMVVICEPESTREQAVQSAGEAAAGNPYCLRWEELVDSWHGSRRSVIGLAELALQWPKEAGLLPADEEDALPRVDLPISSLDAFRPVDLRLPSLEIAESQRREFFAQMHRWMRRGLAVHVCCNNTGEAQRFKEIWAEYGLAEGGTGLPPVSPGGSDAARTLVPGESAGVGVEGHQPARKGRAKKDQGGACPGLQFGTLGQGFVAEAMGLVVVTDAEVFGRYKVQRPRRMKSPHAVAARSVFDISFTDFEPGDYVVHIQQGIGRFVGLERLAVPGARREGDLPVPEQECLVIEYARRENGQPPPKLYVPVTEAHLVSKYVGAGRARPPLSILGGSRWTKTKAQAAEAVRDLAADLLSLQAARDSQVGSAFPPDTPWQREFESAFVYEETPDQVTAIEATRGDLEAPRPMDRLICGDVGFGKTEIAIRAAFKAVMGGRQVAVLVPTTVLAQQHYNTFRERMADYPVRVELLSRFRTKHQQDQVVASLAGGGVDIVIGTHRLLSPDIAFKDLGLVVIDEEQRFGVTHKERLKQVRQLVDVLTLSATPIPRTLYLALTGARDMSTIETPPQDRLPVETIVAPFDERIIREAIERELKRGGQVFFLHNRILDIDAVALRLKSLVPTARIGVGHGQMKADDLEEVMTRFVNGDTDVLLSTTIIESGIDIPNANTIIIDRADRFGLSDLYQLRGRVGRYKHQAFAYLLIPRHAGLLADARKRISAIRQFSAPGSGFKIAMRDLEIRGAGNLLGKEQSGHITAVGFELYCQLLKESVHLLKGEPLKRAPQIALRLDFVEIGGLAGSQGMESAEKSSASSGARRRGRRQAEATIARADVACLHPSYVPEPQQRIELHRRLALLTETGEIEAMRSELRDRFGPVPRGVDLLLQVAELRLQAAAKGIEAIEVREDKLMITRRGDYVMVGGRFPRLTRSDVTERLKEIAMVVRAI